MRTVTRRVKPGADLKKELEQIIPDENILGGVIVSAVGSLERARFRMAGAKPEEQVVKDFPGPLEIVSITGTVSQNGSHIHLSVSDKDGYVRGGHLKQGCIVHTTIELVVLETDQTFIRTPDPTTGFNELSV